MIENKTDRPNAGLSAWAVEFVEGLLAAAAIAASIPAAGSLASLAGDFSLLVLIHRGKAAFGVAAGRTGGTATVAAAAFGFAAAILLFWHDYLTSWAWAGDLSLSHVRAYGGPRKIQRLIEAKALRLG